jgi:ribosome-binding factor A
MKSYRTHTGPSQRQLKVGEEIRHLISDVLRKTDFHHTTLTKTSVNISEVRMSPDLRHARVYILPLQGTNSAEIVTALNELAPRIRHLLAKHLTIKFLPKLKFVEDDAFLQASKIDEIFQTKHVAQDLKKHPVDDKEND